MLKNQKLILSAFWHRVFSFFLGFRWHVRYCNVAAPLKIAPTHPSFETTTRWENPCAPFTLNSFGQSCVSSLSWPFSAIVCESFVFAQSRIIFQWRAEFVAAFVLVCVSTLIRGVLLLLSFLSLVGSLHFSSYWFSRIIAPLHNYRCNRWLGTSPARKGKCWKPKKCKKWSLKKLRKGHHHIRTVWAIATSAKVATNNGGGQEKLGVVN